MCNSTVSFDLIAVNTCEFYLFIFNSILFLSFYIEVFVFSFSFNFRFQLCITLVLLAIILPRQFGRFIFQFNSFQVYLCIFYIFFLVPLVRSEYCKR